MKVLSKLNSLDNVNDGDTRKLITKTSGSGTGNVVSSISVSGDTISYTKDVNALTNHQNTFSTVKVGNTNVAADKAGDTLELAAGSNITLTPDATNNKVTIAATVPTKTSELDNDMNFMSGMTILAYGKSTWDDFITAYTAKHVVYARASSNSNPASGSQTRMAFMAYVNNETNPTEVEFQYYRSLSSHSATQQGDQTYVYKLNKTKGWSVTVRENYTKVAGSDGITGTWSSGTMTLKHDASGVTAGTYNSVTVDEKGHVTAGTNPTTLSGYGITDAKIENGTITLGSNTITPLTSYTEINSNLVNGSATGSLRTISSTEESANYTIGQNALAHGTNTKASGEGSHSEGYFSTASGQYSHAEGSSCSSSGLGSHAEGAFAYANGDSSHAEGYHVIASTPFQHVQGKYNVADLNDTYAHIVGGGTSNTQKNIHTLTWTGEAWYQGDVYVGSTSGTNKDAGSKKLLKEGDVTDTKNTAGSTDTSNKIFLIGATSQAANPQTYSQDTAYVGTDGHLYSNSKQVVNLSDTQALTNKTYNGYTLAAASAKGVDTSISEGTSSTNLPTSAAVANYAPIKIKTGTNGAATITNKIDMKSDAYDGVEFLTRADKDANNFSYSGISSASNDEQTSENSLYSYIKKGSVTKSATISTYVSDNGTSLDNSEIRLGADDIYAAAGNNLNISVSSLNIGDQYNNTSLNSYIYGDNYGDLGQHGDLQVEGDFGAYATNASTGDANTISHGQGNISLTATNQSNSTASSLSLNPNGTASLSANSLTISGVVTPTSNTMAANKQYVDNAVASITPTIPNATSTTVGGIKMRLDIDTNTLYITNDGSNA